MENMPISLSRLKRSWCKAMHNDIAWPRGATYKCRQCREQYLVPWFDPLPIEPPKPAPARVHAAELPHKAAA
jgi:hypothetical protein